MLTYKEYEDFLKYCSKASNFFEPVLFSRKESVVFYLLGLSIERESKKKMLDIVNNWKEFKPIDNNEMPIVIDE